MQSEITGGMIQTPIRMYAWNLLVRRFREYIREKRRKKVESVKDRQREKLQDALSLVILLENDFEAQGMDDMYCRIIHMIHENLRLAVQDQKEQ